jgi:hypothetical protein
VLLDVIGRSSLVSRSHVGSTAAASALVVCVGLACSAREDRQREVPLAWWSVRQAESVTSIRGTPVHVLGCKGLGRGRRIAATTLHRAFACLAGARLSHQRVDTVAVEYVLRPLGPYRGRSSRYALEDVHFSGLQVP